MVFDMVLMIELETKKKAKKSVEDKGDMPFESSDDVNGGGY